MEISEIINRKLPTAQTMCRMSGILTAICMLFANRYAIKKVYTKMHGRSLQV